jgi:copper resistance protein B
MRTLLLAALFAAAPAFAQTGHDPVASATNHAANHAHGNRTLSFTQGQADYSRQNGRDVVNWEAEGWIGNDRDKFWWKTEGEHVARGFETAEFQALYSRNIWTFFDAQAGIRYDAQPDSRGYAVIGVQGLAPQLLETELHAFIGFKGDVHLRFKQSFDLRMTNRFVLQPLVETDFYFTDVPERRVGSGFSTIETGVQARYEINRKFAPTLAVVYESRLGKSARLAQAEGKDPGGWSVRGGVRFWF